MRPTGPRSCSAELHPDPREKLDEDANAEIRFVLDENFDYTSTGLNDEQFVKLKHDSVKLNEKAALDSELIKDNESGIVEGVLLGQFKASTKLSFDYDLPDGVEVQDQGEMVSASLHRTPTESIISTRYTMPKLGTTSRSLPYPTIEDGNLAFPNGEYDVNFQPSGENGGILRHELKGARFIQRLIDQGKAEFACLISVPSMGYRELQRAETFKSHQKISWDLEIVGNQVPMLAPVILYVGANLNHKLTEEDDVGGFWQHQEICIPRGARLAKRCYLRHSLTIRDLLIVRKKGDLPAGSFTVSERRKGNYFYFNLDAHPDIFYFLQKHKNKGNKLCESIFTHAISGCFNILKDRYNSSNKDNEERWRQFPNLVSLSDHLYKLVGEDWNDPGFDLIKVATELRPILNLEGDT